jgi:hypothetical protein
MRRKILIIIYVLISIFVIAYLVWLNYHKEPAPVQVIKEYVEVEKPVYIEKIKKYPVEVSKVITLEREKIVGKEKLPDWLASATEYVILAVGDVQPYRGKTRIISLLNTRTGEGSLIQKQLPYKEPIFEFKRDLRIGGGWDFVNKSVIGRLDFDFLRISKVNFSLTGEVEKNKIGGELWIWIKF